ncbi:beta galactosidase jelly roll domain-containing protein [Pedomonas mirosovicensis]|uniref:beta galactosidase jelly roll domain-containing protein n=1 Tax=Pedomonas mirosovicensis TaxID=2908641 RepID=UPI00216A6F46|nr:beta galactosidase jelly roll domain-containing protein [Pedomonas mirosovicensis]MCH8686184.1 beta galactosidase jelly roll domain-containing protein [Pedomonas mirosovicensis]
MARGPMNNGGLYGERSGWHLPGFSDDAWQKTTLPAAKAEPGVTWYRTEFTLDVPKGHDASLGIAIGDANTPRSPVSYRALIFVNGWNMGQFIAHVGPQRVFVVPSGILNPNGRNTVAIAVTSDGAPGNALEAVKLVNLGTVRGGVPVPLVNAPAALAD